MKNRKSKTQLFITSCLGALSIILGAFSAHGLETLVKTGKLTQHSLNIFEKAVKYQVYGVFVLLTLTLFNLLQNKLIFKWSFGLMFVGVIFFSFSLYAITLLPLLNTLYPSSLFWVTPFGGLLMIIAWIMIFVEGRKIV